MMLLHVKSSHLGVMCPQLLSVCVVMLLLFVLCVNVTMMQFTVRGSVLFSNGCGGWNITQIGHSLSFQLFCEEIRVWLIQAMN